MPLNVQISAPGKLMLSGEYAVLLGAPALVVAVGRRVYARWVDRKAGAASPEVKATRNLAEERWGSVTAALQIDDSQLREANQKLGLGSSAAKAVAMAAAVCATKGHDVASYRDDIFELALEGHRSVAPGGSGADVACSTYGGLLRFQVSGGLPIIEPIESPKNIHWSVISTGTPASTQDLVARVNDTRTTKAKIIDPIFTRIADVSTQCARALQNEDPAALIQGFQEHHAALCELGAQSDTPMITTEITAIETLARAHQGAAKQSGAGGGDVVLAVFDSSEAKQHFESACAKEGLLPLSIELGALGVHSENFD